MIIGGFQKLSLVDFPGVIASVVFTQGCAFRCSYCHNPELIPFESTAKVSTNEVLRYVQAHRVLIEGVCVTGGEPTLQKDLPDFLLQLKKMGLLVKLDTTGINASMVKSILERRLVDYIAMDVKHVWDKYPEVVGKVADTSLKNCQQSFGLIQASSVAHEFRTTVLPGVHAIADFEIMVGYLKPGETYYIQKTRFEKTLDPKIKKTYDFDLDALTNHLRDRYPDRTIILR